MLGQLGLLGYWLWRLLNFEEVISDKEAWRKGILLFVGGLASFGFSFIGFLNLQTITGAMMFRLAGVIASLTGFCLVAEIILFLKQIYKNTDAYSPKQ